MENRLAVIIATILVSALAVADGHDAAGKLIAEAEAERDKARALEFEWRFTSKHIENARKALAAGDPQKASELAEKALFEARTAQEQHAISEKNWILAVPR